MFILVNPNNYVLIRITNSCTPVITNKERVIKCEEEKATAYLLDEGLLYPKTLTIKMYEVNTIPSKVKPYEYLYIEGEFVLNKNYGKPEDYTSEIKNIENQLDVLHTIIDNKMNIDDPEGAGSLSMNRKANSTIGNHSVTLGYNTTASGTNSYAEGNNTLAISDYQHVQGKYNIADGENKYAHIVGGGTSHSDRKNIHTIDWNGNAEFAGDVTATDEEGNTISLLELANNSGSGDYLTSENPTGTGSFSMNRKSDTNIGQYSTAEGYNTTASGDYSHAEGYYSTAGGAHSHAEGYATTAGGAHSHAEGYNTLANGFASHTEGSGTSATDYAHAEGNNTHAQEDYSHTEGNGTITKAQYSHAEGYCTIASSLYQHVQGKWNVEDKLNTYVHIVGGGTSENDRKNIHTIDWNGNAEFAGNITISGNLIQNGNNVLDASNYSNYAATKNHTHDEYLPLSGGTVTGTVRFASVSSYYIDNNANASFANIKQNGNNVLDVSNYSSYAATKDHTHSGYASSGHTHSYLPLSGGTISGSTTITGNIIVKGDIYMENAKCIYGKDTQGNNLALINPQSSYNNLAIGKGLESELHGEPCSLNLYAGMNGVRSMAEFHMTKGGYLTGVLYLGDTLNYWVNSNGNATFNSVKINSLHINANSTLFAAMHLGENTASDGNRYYINANANGRFNILRYNSSAAISSKRYKDNIEYKDFEYWHDVLMQVKPCTFYYKNDADTKHLGLIAEDLYELIPELVPLDDEGLPSSIEYANLSIPLIGEVQRLNSIIDKQQNTIDNLQETINELKSIIDSYLK